MKKWISRVRIFVSSRKDAEKIIGRLEETGDLEYTVGIIAWVTQVSRFYSRIFNNNPNSRGWIVGDLPISEEFVAKDKVGDLKGNIAPLPATTYHSYIEFRRN